FELGEQFPSAIKFYKVREVTHSTRYFSQLVPILYGVALRDCDGFHSVDLRVCDAIHSYVNSCPPARRMTLSLPRRLLAKLRGQR
ncbi:MAG: hypothetical protein V3V96_15790, partial [Acidiferrobacterales bacterium]